MSVEDLIQLDITHLFSEVVGEDHGITPEDLIQVQQDMKLVFSDFSTARKEGKYPYLEVPYDDELISGVMDAASEFQGQFNNLVVLGVGGSALGFLMR